MPRCPVCKTRTDRISYEGVPIYNCGSCGGHWLDDVKLDRILASREMRMSEAVKQKLIEIADASNTRQKLWCVTCATPMVREHFRYWEDIEIDRCPKCNGIWLDRGELEKCQIYWEYLQDNPEALSEIELLDKKAHITAELALRRQKLKALREAAADVQPLRARFGPGAAVHILAGIFGR